MNIAHWIREYIRAFRLLSLTLALGAVGIGLASAYRAGFLDITQGEDLLLGLCILVAGLAAQSGANLINDFFEGSFKYIDPSRARFRFLGRDRSLFDILVFLSGMAAFGLAGFLGLYLVMRSDLILLALGLTGILGAYAYTGEPFVYKTKGLGVFLSWLLMGPLMTLGAWYVFGARAGQGLSLKPVLAGLPLSFLVPALMLSNELRDFHADRKSSLGTLSSRIGDRKALALYGILITLPFLFLPLTVITGVLPPQSLFALLLAPLILPAFRRAGAKSPSGIPWTNALHLLFMSWIVFCMIIFP